MAPVTISARVTWVREVQGNSNQIYKVEQLSSGIYCKACEKTLNVNQKSDLVQHDRAQKHLKNLALKRKRTATQAQLEDVSSKTKPPKSRSEILGGDLCKALLSANIPWNKLENPLLKTFLEANVGITLPGEAIMRKKYLHESHSEVTRKKST